MVSRRSTLASTVVSVALGFGLLLCILGTEGGLADRVERAKASSGGDRFVVTRTSKAGKDAMFTEDDRAAVTGVQGVLDVAGQKPKQSTMAIMAYNWDGKGGEKVAAYPIQTRKVTDNFFSVMGLTLAEGQSFTTATVASHQTPAVMGVGLVEDKQYGLGSVVRDEPWMEGTLVVVGVLNRTGDVRPLDINQDGRPRSEFNEGIDYTFHIPYSSTVKNFRLKFPPRWPGGPIEEWPLPSGMELVVALQPVHPDNVQAQITDLLKSRGYDDVLIRPFSSFEAVFTRVRRNLSRLLLYVALLALFLGAMNVANLSLLKQLREAHFTGVRRAIGATRTRVINGVLWKSLAVAFLGGAIGTLGGFGLQGPMSALIDQKTRVGLPVIIGGFVLLAVATVLSSLYPALAAVQQAPSAAIRWGALGSGRAGLGEKLRRLLAGLGVGVGVAAVTLVIALGRGTQLDIQRYLRSTGQDLLIVREADVFQAEGKARARIDPSLVSEVRAAVAGLVAGVSWQERVQMPVKGATQGPAWVVATDGGAAVLSGLQLAEGRFLEDKDVDEAAGLAVFGAKIGEELGVHGKGAGAGAAVGTGAGAGAGAGVGDVEVLGRELGVKGVVRARTHELLDFGADRDRAIYVPYTYAAKTGLFAASQTIKEVWVSCLPGRAGEVRAKLEQLLAGRYPGLVAPVVVTPAAALSNLAAVQRDLAKVLTVLALIALTVGAFGVTSFMFVRVSEAAPYIGIRRAVGATRPAIARAYLDEAFRLAGVASLAGLGVALAIWVVVALTKRLPPGLPLWSVVVPVLTGLLAGVLFGLWPAVQAANLPPAEAMRRE